MVAGGQPRFTKYVVENYKRILGASELDLYFYLWNDYILKDSQLNFSDYEGTVEEKIKSVLPQNCKLAKIEFAPEPDFSHLVSDNLINHCMNTNYLTDKPNIIYAITNTLLQRYSCFKAFEMIEKEYDVVVRYRVDCYPDRKIILNDLDLNAGIHIPDNMRHGGIDQLVLCFNDQFAIGNWKNMLIYFNAYNYLIENLFENKYTIQPETGLAYHLYKNNVNVISQRFNYFIVRENKGSGLNSIDKNT